MSRLRRTLTLGIVTALAFGLAAAGSAAGVPVARHAAEAAADLSDLGNQAIDDLRRCLTTTSTLNVYYLIDNSGSLDQYNDIPGSDPDKLRADILGSSLDQLSSLEGVSVNWGAGFFSSQFRDARPFAPAAGGDGAVLADLIRAQTPKGSTNWSDATSGAQRMLAAQQAAAPGCQVLVWLTDGAIDLDNDQASYTAANALCGEVLSPQGAAPAPGGSFNELRQSGVVVIGVLLRVADNIQHPDRVAFMRPLVEGTGPLESGEVATCGDYPIPSTYVHGALVEAEQANQLALVFLQLGAQITGGYAHPFDADGGFLIDPGVSKFVIITSDTAWSLLTPGGETWDAATTEPDLAVETSGGATQITVSAIGPDRIGSWRLVDAPNSELYLYSGLSLRFDDDNQIVLGQDAELTGTIRAEDGGAPALENYRFELTAERIPSDGGAPVPIGTAEVDPSSGDFSLALKLDADDGAGQLSVVAHLGPLTTALNGLKLADVSAAQTLPVLLPDEFPQADLPVRLSTLDGSKGVAEGVMHIRAPRDGGAGSVCVSAEPVIVSDSADRETTWKWSFDGETSGEDCVDIAPGQDIEIAIEARNANAAYSSVLAETQVTFTSATGAEITQSVPIEFDSTRPINPGLAIGIFLLLLAAGVLLPLALLWIMNYAGTRIAAKETISRAVIPVMVGLDGVTGKDVDLASHAFGTTEFKNVNLDVDAMRAFDDDVLGTLRARVPINPFRESWFEIVAHEGVVVLSSDNVAIPPSRKKAAGLGAVAFFEGQLGRVWGVVINADALQAGVPAEGRLVIYQSLGTSDAGRFLKRVAEVRVAAARAAKRIADIRTQLLEAKPKIQKPGRKKEKPEPDQPKKPSERDGIPDPRGRKQSPGHDGPPRDVIGKRPPSQTDSVSPAPTPAPAPAEDLPPASVKGADSARPTNTEAPGDDFPPPPQIPSKR